MKANFRRALVSDTGKARHYVEAVRTADGMTLRHSVVIMACTLNNLTERQAEKLTNEITSLLRGGK